MNRLFTALLVATLLSSGAWAQTRAPFTPPPTPHEEIKTLIKSGKLQQALERVEALLVKSPRDAQARFIRTVIWADLGKTAEAMAALEALTQEFPELPEPHNNLGVLLASQGRYEQARAALLRALTAEPNYLTAHENLGDLYVAMAAQTYRHATELAPKSAGLQNKLKQASDLQVRLRASLPSMPLPSTPSPTQ